MSINLTAIFMAIYLFFSGLFYGNQPVKLAVQHCSLDDGMIVCEEVTSRDGLQQFNGWFSVSVTYKNVGRPYRGSSHDAPDVTFYQTFNGERREIQYSTIMTDDMPSPVLVRHGDVRTIALSGCFYDRPENGSYNIEVKVYDDERNAVITLLYEDALIIR